MMERAWLSLSPSLLIAGGSRSFLILEWNSFAGCLSVLPTALALVWSLQGGQQSLITFLLKGAFKE
jgi:hypothetical protein